MTKRIIPCLDIKNGNVVKGVNFVNITDVGDPIEISRAYQNQGADEIVFLDIIAENRSAFYDLIKRAARELTIPITVGGGIRTIEDFRQMFACGASKVSVSTAAVTNPALIKQASTEFGNRVVVAIDAKSHGDNFHVYVKGGREDTGIDLIEWAKKCESLGACEILLTSMDGDGTQNGYDIAMTRTVVQSVSIPVIASGGCGKVADIAEVFKQTNCAAALAASLFHYQKATVGDVKLAIQQINGLIPAIVQDFYTGRVLMLAYVNQESYDFMLANKETCFWSRSRQELWHKGKTSGDIQKIKHMAFDCDNDTLLIQVEQTGKGACHLGNYSCFGSESGTFNILDKVFAQIINRSTNPKEKSYTNYLLDNGVDKICKKVGEEAAETIIAAKNNNKNDLSEEISDLLYHVMVLMFEQGLTLADIRSKLSGRYK